MIKKQSDKFSSYLSRELNYDEEKREVLSYGLQIVLGVLLNVFSVLIFSYILNIFKTTVATFISYIIFRRLIGGAHCDTYGKCYLLGILSMLLLGKLGEIIRLSPSEIKILIIFTYILALGSIILWVPAGTEKKMIKNKSTRKKIKIQSMVLITAWLILSIYLNSIGLATYIISSSLGVILAFFLVTPLGYGLTSLKLFKLNFK